MNYDKDKVDEKTLALLSLVTMEREDRYGARAGTSGPYLAPHTNVVAANKQGRESIQSVGQ